MKAIPRANDLHPDDVRIVVDWDSMEVGMSVFVPCINTTKAKNQITRITKDRGWKMETQVRIEDGKLGVRTWRSL